MSGDVTTRLAGALFLIDTDRDNPGGLAGRSYEDIAAALGRDVRELIAEELEAAATTYDEAWPGIDPVTVDLRNRAAALRGER